VVSVAGSAYSIYKWIRSSAPAAGKRKSAKSAKAAKPA